MKKKVSISVYLVFGGIALFLIGLIFLGLFTNPERAFFERFFDHAWIFIVSLLVVITGTIDARIHKSEWQTDTPQADQSEAPAAGGKIASRAGCIFIKLCAIAFVIVLLLFAYVLSTMRH